MKEMGKYPGKISAGRSMKMASRKMDIPVHPYHFPKRGMSVTNVRFIFGAGS